MARIIEQVDGTSLIKIDPWLAPYNEALKFRYRYYLSRVEDILRCSESVYSFAGAYKYFGLNPCYDEAKKLKGYYYREWAPNANALFITGDFNNWNRYSHPLTKIDNGNWEIFLPIESNPKLVPGSKFKVRVIGGGKDMERIPAYANYVIQNEDTKEFVPCVWKSQFKWKNTGFKPELNFPYKIYEAHIGMAQEKEGVGTYKEFKDNILPRIKEDGYNVVQLMAIQEHPYYGSFGYHVSNFFAPSSRFGTPDELKDLIDTAHGMGLAVIMDIVHSHSCKNTLEGLNQFDGTDYQYFHAPPRGDHNLWDSKVFNYSKLEVVQFLLSNIRYWLEEFRFDGFRFDGVTSMMYLHHGMGCAFDHYDRYFHDIDIDAICYLQLANELIHKIKPGAISIAEDVSGMPGLCRQVSEGGIGFDYRLSMGVPDYWIKILKHYRDEDWNINEIWSVLQNRRYGEKHVSYCESHDQALVGDKTIAFLLMCKEMYWHMNKDDNSFIIDRGIALHKLIRFVTIVLGGEAYLNFMGNEFGHPEWVDFPRAGNGWSYKYAKRQWHLVDDPKLKYEYLQNFDKAMIKLCDHYSVMSSYAPRQLNMDNDNKIMIFERSNLIFVFNFNPSTSIPSYRFGVPFGGKYRVVFSSDEASFGGYDRIDKSVIYEGKAPGSHSQPYSLELYTPSRTALVLEVIK